MIRSIAYERGVRGEDIACDYLVQKGHTILERNYRIPGAEVDVITQDGDNLVFIEVKLRKSSHFGYPEEAVSRAKIQRMRKAMCAYTYTHQVQYRFIRFDIIAIDFSSPQEKIRHICNVDI